MSGKVECPIHTGRDECGTDASLDNESEEENIGYPCVLDFHGKPPEFTLSLEVQKYTWLIKKRIQRSVLQATECNCLVGLDNV